MVRFIRRHAAFLAVILTVAGLAAPASTFAQADAQKAAPADAPAPAAAPAAPAAVPAAPFRRHKETVENPYGLEALWRQGDWVSKGTDHPGDHVDGLLVHHLRQAVEQAKLIAKAAQMRTPSGGAVRCARARSA